MVVLHKVQVTWSGTKGLPGVSTFYCQDAVDNVITSLDVFYKTFQNNIPTGVTITYPSSGLDIDSVTGQAVGSWKGVGTPAPVACNGAGGFAAPVGAVINWHTGAYVSGRELRGKTFMVPLIGSQFDDGTLLNLSKSEFQGAADALIFNAPTLGVWSRKTGTFRTVSTASIPDKAVVLRSRRD